LGKRIAFFDFDGTLTTKDTMWQMVLFARGRWGLIKGFVWFGPTLVFYKLGLVSAQRAKEAVLRFFFKGEDVEQFDALCARFAEQAVPQLIRPQALQEIRELAKANVEMVIVSASLENWVRPWASKWGIKTIATRAALNNGKLTGSIEGVNCNGMEKVNRIKKEYDLSQFDHIVVFGDTSGDLPMLQLGHQAHFKPFR
jgi:HAD superfamily hydrolase (TIGR01490 family)